MFERKMRNKKLGKIDIIGGIVSLFFIGIAVFFSWSYMGIIPRLY